MEMGPGICAESSEAKIIFGNTKCHSPQDCKRLKMCKKVSVENFLKEERNTFKTRKQSVLKCNLTVRLQILMDTYKDRGQQRDT